MNLLEKWREKPSWKATLPMVPIYYSKKTGERDISLSALCSKEKTLTMTQAGFSEIGTDRSVVKEMNGFYIGLTKICAKDITLKASADQLIGAVYQYLNGLWDSNRFHLIFCSAGMDSRILAWVLKRLEDANGKDWLGDIQFRCHEPEGGQFKKAMKLMGWKEDQYSVYKEGKTGQADYYPIADFRDNVNAFHRPQIKFWDDIVEKEAEKDIVSVNGACGGELFSYPLQASRPFTENRFNDLMINGSTLMINFCKGYNKWHDILMPYLGYRYLDVAFRIRKEAFSWVTYRNQKRDSIRVEMMKKFKQDTVPFYIGHQYNMAISKQRIKYIKKSYYNSKFFQDFKHLGLVNNAKPWAILGSGNVRNIVNPNNIDLKLYGYATMYENVRR